jgi:hypothetical protein
VAKSRFLLVATPLSGFRAPCIRAFLISLQKMTFSTGSDDTGRILLQKEIAVHKKGKKLHVTFFRVKGGR